MLTALGEAGLAIWDEWSSQSYKYVPGEPHELWPNMSADGGLGLGTLIFRAINERGAPRFLPRNERSDEELQEDWSRYEERSNRLKQSSEVVDVGEVDAYLADIFCPERITYFWINVPEADHVIQAVDKRQGALDKVLRQALNRRKRQITVGRKRKRIPQSILTNPIDKNGMTRLWSLVCHSDDVLGLMDGLAELGLDSIAYKIPSYLLSSMPQSQKCALSANFPFPIYIGRTTFQLNLTLEKWRKPRKCTLLGVSVLKERL
jgi:hypothetical protein